MAYLTYIGSVCEADVDAIRRDPRLKGNPSFAVAVSHLIAYWVEVQPLGRILGEAVDGGEPVTETLWHPLRPPRVQSRAAVARLHAELDEAWQDLTRSRPVEGDDWYRVEIDKVRRVYDHAAAQGECVLTALDPPADRDRARRVWTPVISSPSWRSWRLGG
jgi:hypothetical protein